jgi:uncharacterized protein (TIGR03435 family)
MKFVAAIVLAGCVQGFGFAQTFPKPLAFQVASVKQVAPVDPTRMIDVAKHVSYGTMNESGDRISYEGVTLKTMLMKAYGLRPYQISGPTWLEEEHYDVAATIPPGTTKEQAAVMLQHLLGDRFLISLHTEMKDEPVYVLALGKGDLKLRPPTPGGEESVGYLRNEETGAMTYIFQAQTMEEFADSLSHYLGRDVTDKSGLPGKFNFKLVAQPEAGGVTPVPASLFSAVRDLGLELQPGKAGVKVKHLVIDQAQKVPTQD